MKEALFLGRRIIILFPQDFFLDTSSHSRSTQAREKIGIRETEI
jgi:hypothetical protein